MKALIIGGAGFVGNYLIEHCKRDWQWSVHVTKMPNETIANPDVSIHDLDILEKKEITALLQTVRPDCIFHLAAQSSVAVSWKNPALTVDVNVKGSINVLEAIRELDYSPRILLIGSGEEYGHILPGETPISERNTPRPGNIYAATKACQNMIGAIYAKAYQMQIMMVRAFNHIGPNQSPLFVVADFCRQVAEIEAEMRPPVIHVGNLAAERDFTDVRDVVRAYSLLIQKGQPGETYNVGSSHAVSIEEVLTQILSLSARQIQVSVDPDRLRPVDIPIIEADITKLREVTNWTPAIPLQQTLEETLNYWRQTL